MPITPFLAGRTFEPGQISVMSAAFTDTCKALGLFEADHLLTRHVAQHVMGLGQWGFKSRAVIYLLTLEEFRYTGSERARGVHFVGVDFCAAVALSAAAQEAASHRTVTAFLTQHASAAASTPLTRLIACKPDGSACAAEAECCSGACKPIGEGRACVSK
jgi:hypothetical protein